MNLVCDLGTTNFRAATAGNGHILSEPAVIAYTGTRNMAIGTQAQRMIGRNPDVINIITPLEGGVIRNMEAGAELIRHCAKSFLPGYFSRRFSLTLSIPSGLTGVEVKALEEAGKLAGARDVQFINSCVAAAIGIGLPIESPTGCLVVNLGGGITEAALLSMKGVVASHVLKTGGQDINLTIQERVKKDYSFLIGLSTAEDLKRQLCEDRETEGLEIRGKNLKTRLPGSLFVERSLVDHQLDAYCDMIVNLISQVISECPPELAGDIIERGIVLAGGGAKVGGLVEHLNLRLEAPVVIPEDPETCVIKGLIKEKLNQAERTINIPFLRRTREDA